MDTRKNSAWILGLGLLLCFSLAACGGGGGGGGGDSGPPAQTSNDSAKVVASLVSLDSSALGDQITPEEFLAQVDQILASVDTAPSGPEDLATYLEDQVVGVPLGESPSAKSAPRAAKTMAEELEDVENSTAYQTLEAFFGSVASSLLVPDPLSTLLDFAKPSVFTSLASVQVRTHIYDAEFAGQIDAPTAAALLDEIRNNPFDAQRALLSATGQTIPEWLEPEKGVCLRDCEPSGDTGSGDTGIYDGPFSGTMTETALGCVWQHKLSGTLEIVVTGSGTLADPYGGTFDMSGTITTSLLSGSDCQPGGSTTIEGFSGSVSGSTGKLNATGGGTIGAAGFLASISDATVSSTAITGAFRLDFGVDNPITETVTLTK